MADPANPPRGCYFHPRCPYAQDVCRNEDPPLVDMSTDPADPHLVACHFSDTLKLAGIERGKGRAKFELDAPITAPAAAADTGEGAPG